MNAVYTEVGRVSREVSAVIDAEVRREPDRFAAVDIPRIEREM